MNTLIVWLFLLLPVFFCTDYTEEAKLVSVYLIGALNVLGYIIYFIISYFIGQLFATTTPLNKIKPQELTFPVVTASAPIPVLFGTRYIKGLNVVWYGNVKTIPWEICS